MSVFGDKKFEQLDWMVQITETIESDLNTLLANLPDRVELKYEDLVSFVGGYRGLSADSIVRDLIRKQNKVRAYSWEEDNKISSCFQFETIGDVELDIQNKTLKGEIFLVKVVPTLTDEELLPLMGTRGIDRLRNVYAHVNKPEGRTRINEILDILGESEKLLSNKSASNKLNGMRSRLSDIFRKNEWRIRDMELADKICGWIQDYIITGNLASLTNFCKVKVMTHNNMPIYSVKEEV